MGICCAKCRSEADKRQYLRTRYNVEREMSVEFDNLMDDDANDIHMPQYGAVMTDHERQLLSERKFQDLVQYQKDIDADIEAQLREDEDQLRQEEEAFYEAKRHATRVARQLKEQAAKNPTWSSHSKVEDWDISNGEDDFEQFLESVRTRSLNTRAKFVTSQAVVHSDKMRSDSAAILCESVDELANGDFAATFKRTKVKPSSASVTASRSMGNVSSEELEWDTEDFVSASPGAISMTQLSSSKEIRERNGREIQVVGSGGTASPASSSEVER